MFALVDGNNFYASCQQLWEPQLRGKPLVVPSMLNETDEVCQMDAFAGRAEVIEDHAGPDDTLHVHGRLQQLLVAHCLIPSDEGPCA